MSRLIAPLLTLIVLVALLTQNETISDFIRSAFRDGRPPDVFLERYPKLADLKRSDEIEDLPHLEIKLRELPLEKLVTRRDLAIKERYLYAGDDDYVSASIRMGKERVRAKLRLKGDFIDQLKGHKWSLRLKIRGGQTLLGMRVFSLQAPESRRHLSEWTTHKLMKEVGVISLRFKFVTVSINGRYLGVYALEEHFDKRLVEDNLRREGPILKISEDAFFHAMFDGTKKPPRDEYDWQYISTSEIQTFRLNSMMENPVQYGYFQDARTLLEDFRQGRREANDVFDVDLLGRYYAMNHISAGLHGHRWHNLRFYYNPVTSRLEPVGFDFNESKGSKNILNFEKFAKPDGGGIFHVWGFDPFSEITFQDPKVFSAYMKYIKLFTEGDLLTGFFEKFDAEIEKLEKVLQAEDPKYRYDNVNFFKNAKYLRSVVVRNHKLDASVITHNTKGVTLSFLNPSEMHLEISSISWGNKKRYRPATQQIIKSKIFVIKSDLFRDAEQPLIAHYPIQISEEDLASLRIHYSVLGSDLKTLETRPAVFSGPAAAAASKKVASDFKPIKPALDLGPLHRESNLQDFRFLKIDETAKTLTFPSGRHLIDHDLVLPAGYRVHAGPGTRIELTAGASIISRSPIQFTGSQDKPIIISATSSAGKQKRASTTEALGQGLLVTQAGGLSLLEYVHFENMDAPSNGNWQVTGAVTFYESDVSVRNSVFANNRSEDALNIVRCTYEIIDSEFRNTFGDAFDADFTKGTIQNTTFINSGNDSIDVSGSNVQILSARIYAAGDKAISIGENSEATIDDLSIEGCQTGIASKDLSKTHVRNSRIKGCAIGLAAYQKKPEFGGGSINATAIDLSGSDLPYIIEIGSSIEIDGDTLRGYGRRKEALVLGRISSGAEFD